MEEPLKILGNGIYSLAEAASLTGLDRSKIRRWFRGTSGKTKSDPVFRSDYEGVEEEISISFHDLVELNVGGQFRTLGFSLQHLRKIHEKLRARWQTDHPFCMKQLATDGKRIFALDLDDNESAIAYDVETFQCWFDEIVTPILDKIDYDEATSLALRWRIDNLIVIDPSICFGKPSVEGSGITTHVLSTSFFANGRDASLVADWYGVSSEQVIAAVSFEGRHARIVA